MPIQWRDQMSVGVPAIDEDHKRLIDLINRFETLAKSDLQGKDEAALRTILGSLAGYARDHFAREERLQAAAGYPGLEENRAEHLKLTAALAAMINRFSDPKERDAPPEDMTRFLQKWLIDHVIKCDLKMKGHKFPKGAW